MYSLNKSLVGTKPGNVGKAELVIGTLLPALRSSKILLFVSVVASGIPLADLLIAFVAQQAARSADPYFFLLPFLCRQNLVSVEDNTNGVLEPYLFIPFIP